MTPPPIKRTDPALVLVVTATVILFALVAQAGSVRTADGRTFEGELHFNDAAALVVKSAQGESTSIELSNVASATFAPGFFFSSGSVLPNGWSVQDIGETRGFSRLEGDAFHFRVEGQSTNATACHFVSRPMHSDGEIIARVEQVGGSGDARAGIMIRAQHSSVFMALSCDGNGRIWFERRPDSDRKETRATLMAIIAPPVWLRFQKREKTVAASCSQDGRTWQTLTEPIKFSAEKTWREAEGDLQLLRGSFGVFASSRGKDTLCTARVAQVAMTLNGLLGEYFSGQRFEWFRFARLDPQIRFSWRSASPEPMLANEAFSVRWTGSLVPPKSGPYGFYFDADDRARVWIDREEMPQVSMKKLERRAIAPMPPTVTLVAGKPVEVKMEFSDGDGSASVKLGWALGGQTPDVIGMTNFIFPFFATNSPERTLAIFATNDVPPMRGVLLRDGSFLAGSVASANESAVRISFAGKKDASVLNSRVARIVLRPPRQPLPYEITSGRTGVFLRNRDFLESEFRGIQWGSVSMSSVLFGLKRFGIENGEVLVVVMNDCERVANGYELRLLDGSVLRAAKISSAERGLTIDEPLLGQLFVATSDLFEMRRASRQAETAAANP